MEQLIVELMKQVPAVGAIIFIVGVFLRHIEAAAEREEKAAAKRDSAVASAMDRTAEVMGRTIEAMGRFDALSDEIARKCETRHLAPGYSQPEPKRRPPA